jgi:hypothetical protein
MLRKITLPKNIQIVGTLERIPSTMATKISGYKIYTRNNSLSYYTIPEILRCPVSRRLGGKFFFFVLMHDY